MKTETSKATGMWAADCEDIPDRHPLIGIASYLRASAARARKSKYENAAEAIIIRAKAGNLTDSVEVLAEFLKKELRCRKEARITWVSRHTKSK